MFLQPEGEHMNGKEIADLVHAYILEQTGGGEQEVEDITELSTEVESYMDGLEEDEDAEESEESPAGT
jgi:hypothetical protein